MTKILVVMAKKPEIGKVKTRLCPPLSLEQATELYRCFVLDKIDQVSKIENVMPAIAFTPRKAGDFFRELVPENFKLMPQIGSDLGERLANVFKELFSNNFRKVVVIGSDSPNLPTKFIERSFDLLNGKNIDVVLGPCHDGGYYLIGLKSLTLNLFEEISWSTFKVYYETIRKINELKLRLKNLPIWYDVDSINDLKKLTKDIFYKRVLESFPAKHTKGFLREQNILHLIED